MPATKRQIGHTALAAGLIATAYVTGATTSGTSQQRPDPAPRPNEAAIRGAGTNALQDGVPVGYERSGRGAVAAATNVVAILSDPGTLDAPSQARVLDAVAAAGAGPQLAARLVVAPAVEEATGLLADVAAGRPLVARVVPVAGRLAAYTADAATVEIWVVAVLGTDRLGAVTSSWSTETLRLVWERADWRISAYDSRGGPVPAASQLPTSLAETLTATQQMRGYTYAPAR
jgi:hypothetical protein